MKQRSKKMNEGEKMVERMYGGILYFMSLLILSFMLLIIGKWIIWNYV